jgi:putative restriction endonuclease
MPANNISVPFFLFENLRKYTENFKIIENVNPYAIEMNGIKYSIHASEIHDSGEGRSNPDEWRIQLQGGVKQKQKLRATQGYTCLFIGFFSDGTAFSAWEPARISALSTNGTGSVYIPHSDLAKVLSQGAAMRKVDAKNLGRQSPEISLPVEALGFYLENSGLFYKLDTETDIIKLVEKSSDALFASQKTGPEELEIELNGKRRKVKVTRESYVRNPKFRRLVLEAYKGSCCVCGRQLGLIEAAHIIPHGHADSNDHISNGLALCVEHHRLYDSAVLIPTSQRKLFLNPKGVEHLRNIGQIVGIEAVEVLAASLYRIPEDALDQPSNDFLNRGKDIRMGTTA